MVEIGWRLSNLAGRGDCNSEMADDGQTSLENIRERPKELVVGG